MTEISPANDHNRNNQDNAEGFAPVPEIGAVRREMPDLGAQEFSDFIAKHLVIPRLSPEDVDALFTLSTSIDSDHSKTIRGTTGSGKTLFPRDFTKDTQQHGMQPSDFKITEAGADDILPDATKKYLFVVDPRNGAIDGEVVEGSIVNDAEGEPIPTEPASAPRIVGCHERPGGVDPDAEETAQAAAAFQHTLRNLREFDVRDAAHEAHHIVVDFDMLPQPDPELPPTDDQTPPRIEER
jgi:hypothetical protein